MTKNKNFIIVIFTMIFLIPIPIQNYLIAEDDFFAEDEGDFGDDFGEESFEETPLESTPKTETPISKEEFGEDDFGGDFEEKSFEVWRAFKY